MTHTNVQPDPTDREPLITIGLLTTIVTAALDALIAFGLQMTAGQKLAVISFATALAPMVAAMVGRGHVYSPATVARLLQTRPVLPPRAGPMPPNPPGPAM